MKAKVSEDFCNAKRSLLAQKRHFAALQQMVTFGGKADIGRGCGDVR